MQYWPVPISKEQELANLTFNLGDSTMFILCIFGWMITGWLLWWLIDWLESKTSDSYYGSQFDEQTALAMGLAWPLALPAIPFFLLCWYMKNRRIVWDLKLRSDKFGNVLQTA